MSKQKLDKLIEYLAYATYTLIDDELSRSCRQECDVFKNSITDYYSRSRNLEDMLWFVGQCRYEEAKRCSTNAKEEYEYLLKIVYGRSTNIIQSKEKSLVVKGNELYRNNFITGQTNHDTFQPQGNNPGIRGQFAVHMETKMPDGPERPIETAYNTNGQSVRQPNQTKWTQSTTLDMYGNSIPGPEKQKAVLNDSTHGQRILRDVTDKPDSIKTGQLENSPVSSPLRVGEPLTVVCEFRCYPPQTDNVNQRNSSYGHIRLDNRCSKLTEKDGRQLSTKAEEENAKKHPQFEHHVSLKPASNKNDLSSCSNDTFNSDKPLDHDAEFETKVEMSTISRSRAASAQLKRNNPNIVDLSDSNRPTKLAEKFSEMYDNEWTEAFVYLDTHHKQKETAIIGFLLEVVTRAFRFGKEESARVIDIIDEAFEDVFGHGTLSVVARKQKEKIKRKHDTTLLAQYLKEHAIQGVKRLQKEFCDGQAHLMKIYRDFFLTWDESHSSPIVTYASRCVELTWWMCVQDPPIYMDTAESTNMPVFNTTTYKAYTRTGRNIDYYVWPALFLEQGGAVLVKGVAQCQ